MATLEDAAEQLVVKLRGLDTEIQESEEAFEDLRERVREATREVEEEWTALREAATSFADAVREEQEQLAGQARETAQAVVEARNAAAEDGAGARQELAEGQAQLESLGQHATGLQPGLLALADEAGVEPARALAEAARELEQQLEQLVEEARSFLQDEVVAAVNDAADEIRQVCETLHTALAEAAQESFEQTWEDWESEVDRLEEYVVTQGYQASHQHARAVVVYALEECDTACHRQLDELRDLVGVLLGQLQDLAGEVEQSAERVVERSGARLLDELERTHRSATAAVAALDAVKRELAAYSFVEV